MWRYKEKSYQDKSWYKEESWYIYVGKGEKESLGGIKEKGGGTGGKSSGRNCDGQGAKKSAHIKDGGTKDDISITLEFTWNNN